MNQQNPASQTAKIVPLYGRDEMNLVEFPFGPITSTDLKTFEVEHLTYDKTRRREVARKMLITGSDAFGLPRPIDDQVLLGMKALTYESGFQSKKVQFSRYQLCRTIGWPTDGRAYQRLEEAFDRIAGVTLKFKDSWWDKGEQEWLTTAFHVIEQYEFCSRDRFQRSRRKSGSAQEPLSSFIWSDAIWKSFQDGYIKKLDMQMFRKISSGRRKEVPLRLYRILDKRLYKRDVVTFDVPRLCLGTLGLSTNYSPSQMLRVLQRAADWLIECDYLREMRIRPGKNGHQEALFIKATQRRSASAAQGSTRSRKKKSELVLWFEKQSAPTQERIESKALQYCQQQHPHLTEGYVRNQKSSSETYRRYREMIIHHYLKV